MGGILQHQRIWFWAEYIHLTYAVKVTEDSVYVSIFLHKSSLESMVRLYLVLMKVNLCCGFHDDVLVI